MTQYIFNNGITLNVTAIPQFSLLFTQQLPNEEIRILVDTSVARTVILPYSTQFPVQNIKITVVDITGGAGTNNIIVQASSGIPDDVINGASEYVIAQNYQASRFELLNTNEWNVLGGSGTGGGIVSLSYDVTIPAARVNQLLEDVTLSDIIIPAPVEANKVIVVQSCSFRTQNATIGRNGVAPRLGLYGIDNANNSFLFATTVGSDGANYLQNVINPSLVATENTGLEFRAVSDGAGAGAISIGSFSNETITQGDGDIRVFGTYYVKQL